MRYKYGYNVGEVIYNVVDLVINVGFIVYNIDNIGIKVMVKKIVK